MGNNAILLYSTTGTGATWTILANIEDIDDNEIKIPQIKITKLTDGAEIYQPGQIVDYGSIKAKLRFKASISATIKGWIANATQFYVTLQVADNVGAGYSGYSGVSSLTLSAVPGTYTVYQVSVEDYKELGMLNYNKEILGSISFKISGIPTTTAGTGS